MADLLEINRKTNPQSRSKKPQTRSQGRKQKKQDAKKQRKRRRSSTGAEDSRRVLPRLSLDSDTAVESTHAAAGTSVSLSDRNREDLGSVSARSGLYHT
jgi:hypothetical protein